MMLLLLLVLLLLHSFIHNKSKKKKTSRLIIVSSKSLKKRETVYCTQFSRQYKLVSFPSRRLQNDQHHLVQAVRVKIYSLN
jgi:hypothetical protein